jgi:hypothetical protein
VQCTFRCLLRMVWQLPICMRSRLQPTCHHAAVLASVQKLLKLQLVLFIQLLRFWTLSIILCVFTRKTRNVSKTGFCLRPLVEPTHLGPADRDRPCLFNLELILTFHSIICHILFVNSGFCSNKHKSTHK